MGRKWNSNVLRARECSTWWPGSRIASDNSRGSSLIYTAVSTKSRHPRAWRARSAAATAYCTWTYSRRTSSSRRGTGRARLGVGRGGTFGGGRRPHLAPTHHIRSPRSAPVRMAASLGRRVFIREFLREFDTDRLRGCLAEVADYRLAVRELTESERKAIPMFVRRLKF